LLQLPLLLLITAQRQLVVESESQSFETAQMSTAFGKVNSLTFVNAVSSAALNNIARIQLALRMPWAKLKRISAKTMAPANEG